MGTGAGADAAWGGPGGGGGAVRWARSKGMHTVCDEMKEAESRALRDCPDISLILICGVINYAELEHLSLR